MKLTADTITDAQIRDLFTEHCECRPINTARISHSHDCDTAYTDDCRLALHAMRCEGSDWPIAVDTPTQRAARARCADQLNARTGQGVVKTLPEILHEAMRLLDDGHDSVVIARGNLEPLDERSSAFQIRLQYEISPDLAEYRYEARSWLGEQWSSWRYHRGWLGGVSFDVSDVLATDWRISS